MLRWDSTRYDEKKCDIVRQNLIRHELGGRISHRFWSEMTVQDMIRLDEVRYGRKVMIWYDKMIV